MRSYRDRPKGRYIQKASLKDLYMLTKSWRNNLEFCLFEIEFLEQLVEASFVKLLLNEDLDKLVDLRRELSEVKNQSKSIQNSIQVQLFHNVDIIDNPSNYDTSIFRHEHGLLEDRIAEFLKILKLLKYVVFKITRNVLESDKPKFIWKYN
ncbi:hypothetical protein [Tenacibaculum sp.]|uniref:hypothetical protein n=1 Tax=Tenacibaculum sp. TaxID=1906242 RepID=UPI003D0FA417